MAQEKFAPKGVYSAMMTPFEGGVVSARGIRDIIEFLEDKGADGVFPVSNVGEFLTLSQEEKKQVIAAVCQCVKQKGGRMKVIPGVSDLSPDRALELCEYSKAQGADGVVVCAPYYYPYQQSYISDFLLCIADNSPLPVILYNSPKFANPIEMPTLIELLSHPNVTGMKESSGDIKAFISIMEQIKRRNIDVNVLVGWEELFFTALTFGAAGCITSCGGIVPEILQQTLACYNDANYERAAECEASISRITAAIGEYGFPFGYKAAVLARGLRFDICRSLLLKGEEARLQMGADKLKAVIEEELCKFGINRR